MSLLSFEFIAFLTVVIGMYLALPQRVRWVWLLAASFVFYASFGLPALALLLMSILADYLLARQIGRSAVLSRRRLYLGASLLLNLGSLLLFKYLAPAVRSTGSAAGWLAFAGGLPSLGTPIGLSFFTFAKLGYVVDVYRRKSAPEPHLGYFAAFVAFFPNITSGPIERAEHLLPQLRAAFHFDPARTAAGLRRVLWGLFKKVVIADRLASFVDGAYNQPGAHPGPVLALATFFLAFQIYADFSGYTDIALGIAQIFGIELFENFRQPYLATSLLDFWRRWHISLTHWIREYVFFPLSRWLLRRFRARLSPQVVQALSYLVLMGLVGLWHGAQKTFLAWGLLHGLYLIVEMRLPPRWREEPRGRLEAVARAGLTFALVSFAWILFRANSLHDAFYVITHLFSLAGMAWIHFIDFVPADPAVTTLFLALGVSTRNYVLQGVVQLGLSLLLVALLLGAEVADARRGFLPSVARAPAWVRWPFYYALTAGILMLGVWGAQAFLYFRF